MDAAAAARRRVSHAAKTPPAAANSSRRLIQLIIQAPVTVGLGRVRQPVHLVLHLPGEVVEITRAARQQRDAAMLCGHDDAGHPRLVEGAARAHLLVAQDEHRDRAARGLYRSEEHTSELQSQSNLVCRLLLETK